MDNNIYSQEFIHYYKNPVHKKTLDKPSTILKSSNLSCGDSIELSIKVASGVITDVGYTGVGCIVSMAAAEMLSQKILGKNIDELKRYTKEDFLKEVGFDLTPSRQKCALICYNAFTKIYDQKS